MAYLLALHLVVAVVCAALGPALGSRVMAVGALAPAVSFGWLCVESAGVLAGTDARATVPWAAPLGLELSLRLDGLALLLGLLVTGVGAVVLLYSVHYFAGRDGPRHGVGRVAAVLTVFAGAMLLLVLADHLLALYVAWELTTVCSFLLIGDDGRERSASRAAARALLVTTGSGFVMLLGLLLLGESAGTYQISGLLADPPQGAAVSVAAVLILIGAFGKSAQVPLHSWLPAAMVAATPISAYLHAAAMVKAGVYLVARLAPAFADTVPWSALVLTVGLLTMVLGGWRALAQTDLKRLLAYGTIAQLGFLMVLLGAGTRTAALAGATMLLAHALFKSALFLVVGIIDHEVGTRDLRELSGVRRASPGLVVVSAVACLSMAGLPPTVGYLGKEAAFEAFVEPAPGGLWVLAGLVLGSTLTVAYTLRFLWGAFGDRAGVDDRAALKVPVSSLLPTALVSLAGLVVAVQPRFVDALATGHAASYPSNGSPYHLALWHGVGPPLLLSALTLAVGAGIHLVRGPLGSARGRVPVVPLVRDGQEHIAAAVVAGARRLTAVTQVGSLPAYLTTILLAVVVGPGLVLVLEVGVPSDVRLWDTPQQAVLAAGVAATVGGVLASGHRLAAVLMLSAAGYLVAALFVVHGASDLALVQVLVETLTLLLFVLVLRRMPAGLPTPPTPLRTARAALSVLVGVFATAVTLAAGARYAPSRSTEGYFREAPQAGGPNVVNVVITEFRALDTLGEVTVLAIASTGVASLVLVSTRMGNAPRRRRAEPAGADAEVEG